MICWYEMTVYTQWSLKLDRYKIVFSSRRKVVSKGTVWTVYLQSADCSTPMKQRLGVHGRPRLIVEWVRQWVLWCRRNRGGGEPDVGHSTNALGMTPGRTDEAICFGIRNQWRSLRRVMYLERLSQKTTWRWRWVRRTDCSLSARWPEAPASTVFPWHHRWRNVHAVSPVDKLLHKHTQNTKCISVGSISYDQRQTKQENSGGQNSAVRLKIWIREENKCLHKRAKEEEKWKCFSWR